MILQVKITSLDSASEDEAPSPSEPEPAKPKKRTSSSGARPIGEPLATSSPLKDAGTSEEAEPKKKISVSKDESEPLVTAKKRSSVVMEDGKKKKRKSASLSVDEDGHSKKRQSASLSVDGNGHSKRQSASLSVDGNPEVGSAKRKKKISKSQDSAASLSNGAPDASKLSSSSVKVVEVEINTTTTTQEKARKRKSSKEQRATGEADRPKPDDEIDRSNRNRRSNSPKSRYRMEEEEKTPEAKPPKAKASKAKAAAEPEKVTIGVVKKKKKAKDEGGGVQKSTESGKKPSKKKKSKSEGDEKEEKKKKPKKKKKSSTDVPSTEVAPTAAATENMSLSVDLPLPPPGSAAISGSIESNTMTYTAAKHGSKSSLNKPEQPQERQNATLPRRKSADHSSSSAEGRVSHSTSSSDIREETEKAFRRELREASQSQHDMKDIIDIDPNIKVKKGGVIKEGRAVGRRPNLPSFDQSSSPEPGEMTPISSGAVEDNILNPEFKMKKSGVVVGKKTSTSTRPSILDEQKEKTPPQGKCIDKNSPCKHIPLPF